MPQLAVYDMAGVISREIDVPDDVLGLPVNRDLIHQAVLTVDRARKRKCGKAQRRGDVDRTSAKMYRQKGLGRARHGARTSPTFVGGAAAHGPTGEMRSFKMPKRMRRKAVYTALSLRAAEGNLLLVDEIKFDQISTSKFAKFLNDLNVSGRILLLTSIVEAEDEVLYKSCRNIDRLIPRGVPNFNTRDVIWAEKIIVTSAALEILMGGGEDDAES